LLSQGAIDFDDILSYTYKILNDNPEILKIYNRVYKSICIDEAQDLNKAQYEIIKLLAGEKIDVTMVGDISQSIYGFNGSSSKYFANDFEQDFNAEKIELLENFRSSKKVIEAAKKIDGSFNIECVWPIEGEFEIYDFPNQYEEAKWVLEKIDSLKITGHNDVEGKVISDDKIAIIGRNRYVFKQLELLLKENKRPYILKASNDNSFVCESVFMKCFELGIKLIVNPKDKIHLVELSQELSIAEQINNLDDIKK
jgi:DNA helicase-2/ATP-dependent DNA helicase PcrA